MATRRVMKVGTEVLVKDLDEVGEVVAENKGGRGRWFTVALHEGKRVARQMADLEAL